MNSLTDYNINFYTLVKADLIFNKIKK